MGKDNEIIEVVDCECVDFPVTYCVKCKRLYVLDNVGNRMEIYSIEEKDK